MTNLQRLGCAFASPWAATYDETGEVDFTPKIGEAYRAYNKLVVSAGESDRSFLSLDRHIFLVESLLITPIIA